MAKKITQNSHDILVAGDASRSNQIAFDAAVKHAEANPTGIAIAILNAVDKGVIDNATIVATTQRLPNLVVYTAPNADISAGTLGAMSKFCKAGGNAVVGLSKEEANKLPAINPDHATFVSAGCIDLYRDDLAVATIEKRFPQITKFVLSAAKEARGLLNAAPNANFITV